MLSPSLPSASSMRGHWRSAALFILVVVCLFRNPIRHDNGASNTRSDVTDHGNYEYRYDGDEPIRGTLRASRLLQSKLNSPWNADKPSDNGGVNPFIPKPWETYSPVPPPGIIINITIIFIHHQHNHHHHSHHYYCYHFYQ